MKREKIVSALLYDFPGGLPQLCVYEREKASLLVYEI